MPRLSVATSCIALTFLFVPGCSSNTCRVQLRLAECDSGRPLGGVNVQVHEMIRILPGFPTAAGTTNSAGAVWLRLPSDQQGKLWNCRFSWKGQVYAFPIDGSEYSTTIQKDRDLKTADCVQARVLPER